jgi:hypothetical protein
MALESAMPKNPVVASVAAIAAAACALCWLVPLPPFEASAGTRAEYYPVSKQLFDPEVFGNVRSSFSVGVSKPSVEGRSVGRTTEPMRIPAEIKAPAEPQCEPRPSARKNEPQFG